MSLRELIVARAQAVLHSDAVIRRRFPDVDGRVIDIFNKAKAYTMTSPERVIALCDAVRYVAAAGVEGAVVTQVVGRKKAVLDKGAAGRAPG